MTVYSRFAALGGMVAIVAILSTNTVYAQTTIFSSGFEASAGYSTTRISPATFTNPATGEEVSFNTGPGSLFALPDLWYQSRVGSETFAAGARKSADAVVVTNTVAATGTQSLLVTGTTAGSQSVRYDQRISTVAATNGVLMLSADVRVFNPSASAFGQWGINLLAANPVSGLSSLAAFGTVGGQVVASSDGSDLYAAINALTGAPITASYGSFNNYAIQMNYSARNFSGFFNNAQVAFVPVNASGTPIGNPVLNIPFAAGTTNTVTDFTIGQFTNTGSAESANFDNFRISGTNVAVVPEAGTFSLIAMGATTIAGTILVRRRKTT